MKGPIAFAGHLGLRGPDGPLLAHSAASLDPLDQIDALADHGFAGVQDIFLKLRTTQQRDAMAERMAARGLSMGTFNGDPQHWNTPLWSSADADARPTLRRNLDESIAVAHQMGGGMAVCVCGLDADLPHAAQLDGMVCNLAWAGEIAARAGLTLLVEAVADAWIPGLLISRLSEAAAVVRTVNLPSVRLLFDTGHVGMAGDDVLAGLADNWDIIAAIQVSDVPGRIDVGAGTLDWPAIFGLIVARGYAGLVEVEHEPMDRSAQGEARLVERLRAITAAL